MASTYPKTPDLNRKFVVVDITDISTADQIYFVPGFAGKIKKIWSCLNDALANVDAILLTKIATVAVTGGTITVAYSGSASGDIDSTVPTALNSFTASQAIEVETNGASTNTSRVTITFELEAT